MFNFIYGTPGIDTINGTTGDDWIRGLGGDDTILGLAGNDNIDGDDGDDIIFGGTGNDTLVGGTGNDEITGGDFGFSTLHGEDGNDALDGGKGNADLYGGSGNDRLTSNGGWDYLYGEAGDDLYTIGPEGRADLIETTGLDKVRFSSTAYDDLGWWSVGDDLWIDDASEIARQVSLFGPQISTDQKQSGVWIHDFFSNGANTIEVIEGSDFFASSALLFLDNGVHLGSNAADTILGFSGNDHIEGNQGDDLLYGGDAVFEVSNGRDTYVWTSGDGNDRIFDLGASLAENDRLQLTDVASTGVVLRRVQNTFDVEITVNATGEKITVDSHLLDYSVASYGLESIEFSDDVTWSRADIAANVRTEGGAGDDLLVGTDAPDNFYAKAGNDLVEAGAGDDIAYGGDGNDTIRGGDGDDFIDGNGGDDIIEGGAGNDVLAGGTGVDYLYGGDGNDILRGGGGADFLYGEDGEDEMYGTSGEDQMFGGDGNDYLEGLSQSDVLHGGTGDDVLKGGDGYDDLYGDAGSDILQGGNGIDLLNGGAEVDTLTGGAQSDTFVFSDAAHSGVGSADVILDFEGAGASGGDVIDVSGIDADMLVAGNDAFTFLGVKTTAEGLAFGAGALWLENSGTQTRLYGIVDDDGIVDLEVKINDSTTFQASDYIASDFLL